MSLELNFLVNLTDCGLEIVPKLRLGTRASALARWQAEWVAARLGQLDEVEVELVLISTRGDQQKTGSIGQIGTEGVFTKEIQRALLDNEVDLAVHSLKDLPTEKIDGLILGAVPQRASVHDALVSRENVPFDQLPVEAVVGTGSLRRRAQLWHTRPDLRMDDVRGNVETRLAKLSSGAFDALILAEAGLTRLGLGENITQVLPTSLMLPAVGQGALGIECREDDETTRAAVAQIDDAQTHAAVLAERAMLAGLRGGCLAPVGALGQVEHETVNLTGVVLSADGTERLEASATASPNDALALGKRVAGQLLEQGAAQLIADSRA